MSRFKKSLTKVDWTNHVLTFIGTLFGVFLAFYLANSQERLRDQRRLNLGMEHIREEILKNYQQTKSHFQEIEASLNGIIAARKLMDDDMEFITTEKKMTQFKQEHPGFFTEKTRKPINDSLFQFDGDFSINMNLLSPSEIAWENMQAMDILHLLDYQTSYRLHALYGIQKEIKEKLLRGLDLMDTIMENEGEALSHKRKIIDRFQKQMRTSLGLEEILLKSYEGIFKELDIEVPPEEEQ